MLRRSTYQLAAVGFIGMGQMGSRMAPNLFKSKLCSEIHYFDTANAHPAELAGVKKNKLIKCDSVQAVAKACKYIITMLPNGAIVRDVYGDIGGNGILGALQKGTYLVDCSTVDPDTPKFLNKKALEAGASVFVDAPVSGGVNAAAQGILTFLVGTDNDKAFKEGVEPLLNSMGKNVLRCGKLGSGVTVKLCNNLILAQHMIGVSEAMLLGTRLGVDPKILADCVNVSTGRCWTSELYNPFPGVCPNVPASNNYKGGFGCQLMLKDLKLAIEAAQSVNLETPGGDSAKKMYTTLSADEDLKNCDFSATLKLLDRKK